MADFEEEDDAPAPVPNYVPALAQLSDTLTSPSAQDAIGEAAAYLNNHVQMRQIADDNEAAGQNFVNDLNTFKSGMTSFVKDDPTGVFAAMDAANPVINAVVKTIPGHEESDDHVAALTGDIHRELAHSAITSAAEQDAGLAKRLLDHPRIAPMLSDEDRTNLGAYIGLQADARDRDHAAQEAQLAEQQDRNAQGSMFQYAKSLWDENAGKPVFPDGWHQAILADNRVTPQDTADLRSMYTRLAEGGPPAGPQGPQQGLLEEGNIDLKARPTVPMPGGGIATVRSMSFEEDGKEVLIPTVAQDGSRILSDEEAIDQYHKTGQHLGKFDTPDNADSYGERLHDAQDKFYNKRSDAGSDPFLVHSIAGQVATGNGPQLREVLGHALEGNLVYPDALHLASLAHDQSDGAREHAGGLYKLLEAGRSAILGEDPVAGQAAFSRFVNWALPSYMRTGSAGLSPDSPNYLLPGGMAPFMPVASDYAARGPSDGFTGRTPLADIFGNGKSRMDVDSAAAGVKMFGGMGTLQSNEDSLVPAQRLPPTVGGMPTGSPSGDAPGNSGGDTVIRTEPTPITDAMPRVVDTKNFEGQTGRVFQPRHHNKPKDT